MFILVVNRENSSEVQIPYWLSPNKQKAIILHFSCHQNRDETTGSTQGLETLTLYICVPYSK